MSPNSMKSQLKTVLWTVALFLVSHSLHAEDWVSLFDGKSTSGWEPNEKPESFSVENGQLKFQGGMAHLFCVKEEYAILSLGPECFCD